MALAKCKECGNDVSTGAGKCPKCGFPLGHLSRILKKIGIVSVAVVAVLVCMVLWGGHLRSTPIGTFHEMETVTVGNASYYVAGSNWLKSLNPPKCSNVLPDICFLIVGVAATNNDSRPQSVPPLFLIDENGASYGPSRKAACVNEDAISSEDLNPGAGKLRLVAFDVPQNHKYRLRVFDFSEYPDHALILLNPKDSEFYLLEGKGNQ